MRSGYGSSLRHLSDSLKAQGHSASPNTVGRLLRAKDYSLKSNVKRQGGTQHPDRNTQFEYIEAQKQYFLSKGWPIISIDVKISDDWQFQEHWSKLVPGS